MLFRRSFRTNFWNHQILLAVLVTIAASRICLAQEPSLKQVKTFPLNGVEGRIDHMYVSPDGDRLFIAEIGNDSVEVLNPKDGTHVARLEGLKEPQGVVYVPEYKRLIVASGGDSNVRIYDDAFKLIGTIIDLEDADNVRYDAQAKLVYAGYTSALAVIDPYKMVKVADISLDGHAESFRLEANGNRIFVNVPAAKEIEVVDRTRREVIAKWPMTDAQSNFPMILDEEHHRLLVACRRPAKMLAIDTASGKVVTAMDCVSGSDDLFYDTARKRIYVSGSGGSITVIGQTDPDHYRVLENFKTAPGAQTSFFAPDPGSGLLYLAVPHRGEQKAEIRVYSVAADAATTKPSSAPLSLQQSILLPQITRGMNHMDVDVKHMRAFVTAPSDKLLAIIDLKENRVLRTITGYGPAAARFLPDLNQLCVSGAKAVTFYDGDSFDVLAKVDVGSSVDEMQYDSKTHRLYIGITDATEPGVAIIDVTARTLVGKIKLPAKPQGIQLDASGERLFANTTGTNEVTVIDCPKQSVLAEWKLEQAKSNYPIAIDDRNHRLFVGCRNPASTLVFDSVSGKLIASIECGPDTDDMSFDPATGRIYLACGGGVITAIQQDDPDHYHKIADVPTAAHSRNSLLVSELKWFLLATPKQDDKPAELRVYGCED